MAAQQARKQAETETATQDTVPPEEGINPEKPAAAPAKKPAATPAKKAVAPKAVAEETPAAAADASAAQGEELSIQD